MFRLKNGLVQRLYDLGHSAWVCLCVSVFRWASSPFSRTSFFYLQLRRQMVFIFANITITSSNSLLFAWSQTRALFVSWSSWGVGWINIMWGKKMNRSTASTPNPSYTVNDNDDRHINLSFAGCACTRGIHRSQRNIWLDFHLVHLFLVSNRDMNNWGPISFPQAWFPFFIHLLNRGNNSTFNVTKHRTPRLKSPTFALHKCFTCHKQTWR